MADEDLHLLEKPKPLATLATLVFWAVGVGLMDPRLNLGLILCLISIGCTLWLFWNHFKKARLSDVKSWPWFAIVLIAIQVMVPGYIAATRKPETDKTSPSAVTSSPCSNFGNGNQQIITGGCSTTVNGGRQRTVSDSDADKISNALGQEPSNYYLVMYDYRSEAVRYAASIKGILTNANWTWVGTTNIEAPGDVSPVGLSVCSKDDKQSIAAANRLKAAFIANNVILSKPDQFCSRNAPMTGGVIITFGEDIN